MTVSYQGPTFLEGIVRWSGTKIFDRVDKLNLAASNQIKFDEIAPFRSLQEIKLHGLADKCKTQLERLIPKDRLSHFEMSEGLCTAVLK